MSEVTHLSEALAGFFGNPENGWFMPITVASDGLTAAQAACIPAPRFNSIWAIVNHVNYWQKFFLLKLQGKTTEVEALGPEDGWPPAGYLADEEGWKASREAMIASNRELIEYLNGLADAELDEPYLPGKPRRCEIIQGLISHNSYHACEVISVRHMQGLWLERT